MNRKLSFSVDDESNDIIKRYEQFLTGKAPGYFDVEELESIVEYYLRHGRTKDSSKAVELGLQLHPNNTALQTKRAKIYLATGDEIKALRTLNSLSETFDYDSVLLKIEVLIKLQRFEEANLLTKNLVENNTSETDTICLEIAFVYLGQGEYEIAMKLLDQGDKHNPKNVDLLFELAFCSEQCGDYTKAIDTYNRIIDIDSYLEEAWFNLGQIHFATQDYTNALEAYEFALTINEKDSLSCLQKGHVHFQLDQFELAIESYVDYGKMTSTNWETDLFIAECYEKLERFETSIQYYKQSLEAHPENFDALTGIGICLLEQEKYAESIEYIQRALDINENAPDAWVYMAEALVGIDQIDNALIAYIKSIALDTDQPDTLMAIANIYLEKGDYETAIEYYEAAYELDNEIEYAELFIAVAYFKQKKILEAIPYLKKAVSENENASSLFLELCPEAIDSLMLNNDPE